MTEVLDPKGTEAEDPKGLEGEVEETTQGPAPDNKEADIDQALKSFLQSPEADDEEKEITTKGVNRLTRQAKAAREQARLEADAERQKAKAEADRILTEAKKRAGEMDAVAIAKTMVARKIWTKEQANEYLEAEGIEQPGLDPDALLGKVAETVAATLQKQREADQKAREADELKAKVPVWRKAIQDVLNDIPAFDANMAAYFVGIEYNAGKSPEEAVKSVKDKYAEKFGGSKPLPEKEIDTNRPLSDKDIDAIAEKDRKKYSFWK